MSEVAFNPKHLVWTEKYRPSTIADCVIPERIKTPFSRFVDDGDFPALLLAGSPGIGKTTIARALCQDLGLDYILINASNERGIDTLRTTITSFATTVSFNDAKIKCVIMDEFDQSSNLLQTAMRAAIEDFSVSCRFIFTCNYPNKIIDAIHSRCSTIALSLESEEKPIMAGEFMKRICAILKQENVEFERKAIASIIQKFFPDFRRVLNELQRISRATDKITLDVVNQASEDVNIARLVKHLREKNFPSMRQWVASNSQSDFNIMFRKIYDSMSDFLVSASIPEAIVILAQYQYKGTTCPDPEINMVAFLTEIMAACSFKE